VINPSNPKVKRAHNVRWIRLADHMVCRCPATGSPGGPWTSVVVACSSPDLGGTSEGRTALVNGFKARDPSGQRSPPSHS
jgi:hypothetical protein